MNRKAATPKPAPLPGHVLVVEDDAVLVLALEQALLDAGVQQVDISPTTDHALELMRHKRPDVIVLDVYLADRDDGWALAELVQSLGRESPRIVFSTGMPNGIPDDIAALGCILTKPYDAAALVDLLRQPPRRGIISRLRGALR